MGVFEFLAKGVGTVLLTVTGVASMIVESAAESTGSEDLAAFTTQVRDKSFDTIRGFWREKPKVELTEEQLEQNRVRQEEKEQKEKYARLEREMVKVRSQIRKAKDLQNEQLVEIYKNRLEDLKARQRHYSMHVSKKVKKIKRH